MVLFSEATHQAEIHDSALAINPDRLKISGQTKISTRTHSPIGPTTSNVLSNRELSVSWPLFDEICRLALTICLMCVFSRFSPSFQLRSARRLTVENNELYPD